MCQSASKIAGSLNRRFNKINRRFELASRLQYEGTGAQRGWRTNPFFKKEIDMDQKHEVDLQENEVNEEPLALEEIQVEELAIDGICGVY